MASALRFLSAGAVVCVSVQAAHWAVIMAGSKTYGNYRHQADAFHAYQIAVQHGIPESNIILIAYDDIAESKDNPFKGKVFNRPDGKDMYEGVKISYRGDVIDAELFLKVLKGDTNASGPVLKSTAEDHVFVYYADHGGPGVLGVPSGFSKPIHAADINDALVEMHQKGMYKELLFYLESCESGSIFNKLLTAPNVKAVTASDPSHSSYGTYCPPNDRVQGKAMRTCLGDLFSVNWLEDADAEDLSKETVREQVSKVKSETNKSTVEVYGTNSFDGEVVGDFLGSLGSAASQRKRNRQSLQGAEAEDPDHSVDARDIEVHLAFWAVRRAQGPLERKAAEAQLQGVLARRLAEDAKFLAIAMAAVGHDLMKANKVLEGPITAITEVACHRAALNAAVEHCGPFSDYSLRYSRLLVNLCQSDMTKGFVVAAVQEGCTGRAAETTAEVVV